MDGRAAYLLYHTLVELFSILVACGIFMIVWNARRYLDNDYLLFVGIAYLFVAGIDVVHTLGYTGMGIFPHRDTNLPAQLWIAARYMQAVSLLIAPAFLVRRAWPGPLMLAYAAVTAGLIAMVFGGVFPDCFVEGRGLTAFKTGSEYVICGLLAGAVGLLLVNRHRFDRRVLALIAGSLAVTMASELAFTLYTSAYGLSNFIGHVLKFVAFFLMYLALIQTALRKPYDLLFRKLQLARNELEQRVQQRTGELRQAVEVLQAEVQARIEAEQQALQERQRLFSVLQMLPGYVSLHGPDHRIRFANHKFLELFGEPGEVPYHKLVRGQKSPCRYCQVARVLSTGRLQQWEWTDRQGRTFRTWAYPFTDTDGTELALELGIDVTDQKRLERQIVQISDRERSALGRELHDTVGQMLTGISFMSKALAQALAARSATESAQAAQISELAGRAISQARAIAAGLAPVAMAKDGLMHALGDYAARMGELFGVQGRFECNEPVLIEDNDVAINLFRIVQEATNNAVRHGRPRTVTIRLERTDNRILLTVADDGTGLPEHVDPGKGLGMHTMRYRANVVGASFDIARRDGGGTAVRCSLPMARPNG